MHNKASQRKTPSLRFGFSSPAGGVAYLLSVLAEGAGLKIDLAGLAVESVKDGEMGSLKLGEDHAQRRFGRVASEMSFKDEDGILVIATLYLDTNGLPYELDVFKVDFTRTESLCEHS